MTTIDTVVVMRAVPATLCVVVLMCAGGAVLSQHDISHRLAVHRLPTAVLADVMRLVFVPIVPFFVFGKFLTDTGTMTTWTLTESLGYFRVNL